MPRRCAAGRRFAARSAATVKLRYRGNSYAMRTYCLGPERYRIEVDGSRIDAHLHRLGPFEYWLTTFGQRSHVVSVVQGLSYRIEVDGVSHRIERDDGGVVHAPAPAVVVSIAVKPGDMVSAGDRLVVLEAMKMEMQVVAPFLRKRAAGHDDPQRAGRYRRAAGADRSIRRTPKLPAASERVVFGTALTDWTSTASQARWRQEPG